MAYRSDRRRLAFESLESRGMLAAVFGSLDTAPERDASWCDIDSPPATDAACEPGPIDAIPVPDAFIMPVEDSLLIVDDAPWVVDDALWVVIDEPWFFDDAAADGWCEPMFVFCPAPEEAFAILAVGFPADGDGDGEPMDVALEQAGVEQEAELPDPGTEDGRQMVFATLAADGPAPTARGPSATAIRHQMAAAFGFSLPAADGDAFWTGFGIGTAKRRTR
jgi:hypothetical protein